MVTSFIEMLELPNFYRNARVNHIDNIILVMWQFLLEMSQTEYMM